ncbi:MAG: ABC transporter substrate binding protein [Desulfovermiculus sp.]|nr:ABC transporter substrate binding protein [Desulfovermiculus sp.]
MADKPVHTYSPIAGIALGLVLILCLLTGTKQGFAQNDAQGQQVAILISKHIKPYMEAAAGLEEYLQDQGGAVRIILFAEKNEFQKEQLTQELRENSYQAAVGIGPQAMEFLWAQPDLGIPIVFSMVLHPEQLVTENSPPLCGVTLSLPVDIQLRSIEDFLPGRSGIGLLFHPEHNQELYLQAAQTVKDTDRRIVPLAISEQGDIPDLLANHLGQIDALWLIPDQALTSQKVVEYIIKQALYAKVPVIGYNRFFHQSGAAISFVFDYDRIGRQTGRVLMRRLTSTWCEVVPADFEVWENDQVFDLLGLDDE